MIEKLSEKIWGHTQFHKEVSQLIEANLRNRYINQSSLQKIPDEQLKRLLQCASTLSASKSTEYRETAYKIVTAAAELVGESYAGVPYLMLLVLGRIGNFPAFSYAKSRFNITEESLPVRALSENTLRSENNTVQFGDSTSILTDFQLDLWNKLNSFNTLGISAPTSAGKSYVLQAYARKLVSNGKANNIVFLVPTRALINQVSREVSEWVKPFSDSVELIITPIAKKDPLPNSAVYVITQERLQLLQTSHKDLTFDLMLVDEAQSLADGPRGVLLSSGIEEAVDRNPKMQLLFAGPNLQEPGKMAHVFARQPETVSTNEAAVVQNIIFVDSDPEKSTKADLSLKSNSGKCYLGKISCKEPLIDHKKKLTQVALSLGSDAQNLIYALGPAECEQIAFNLADTDKFEKNADIDELAEFIRDAIHPKCQLAKNVQKNIGYHYGRLPSLVRKTIEDAFISGSLQFLVTTSTLLQGVNLPAQNLFLHNPKKGQDNPIPSTDFWNLAGRAGRLGKEFSGNVFLIDYEEWKNAPLEGPKDKTVIPALQQHILHETEQLISYINAPDIIPERNNGDIYENTFVKLVEDSFNGNLERTLDRLGLNNDTQLRLKLIKSIEKSVSGLSVSKETLSLTPTVSPYRQQSLYEWIEKSLITKGAAYVIPKHPQDPKAYHSYLACIKRCHGSILKYPKPDKSHTYYASLCKRWMTGDPLPKIIDASFKNRRVKGMKPSISTVIRETLNEIERDLRFKYVRLFSCYNAVLEQVLIDNNFKNLCSSIPPIPMYLELGACSPTMISFLSIGLSRYTSSKLQNLPQKTDMSPKEARIWIELQDIQNLQLPATSINEIKKTLLSL